MGRHSRLPAGRRKGPGRNTPSARAPDSGSLVPMHHRHAAAAFLFLVCPLLAQQGDPILQQLPHDANNLLVIRDPLPHLDAALASPALAELMSSTASLQRELFGAEVPVSPEQLRGLLGTVREFVPTELVLATTPASQMSLARLLRGALDVALIQMLSGTGAAMRN